MPFSGWQSGTVVLASTRAMRSLLPSSVAVQPTSTHSPTAMSFVVAVEQSSTSVVASVAPAGRA